MKRPSISVIVPVYNVEKLLPRCLDSVLAQTIDDFEIVCVNDASPDNSLDILKKFRDRDSRIVIVDKPVNEGPMMARQSGCDAAGGDYYFFLDSDDYLPAGALAALLSKARETDADITMGEMVFVNPQGRKVSCNRTANDITDSDSYLRSILHWGSTSLCGSLFSRRLFDGHDYSMKMHQTYSEDRILLTQILLTDKVTVATVSDETYYYWLNQESSTHARITDKVIQSQFSALFHCYDMVARQRPDLEADNNNFIIRYMGLYIEKGAPVRAIRDFNDTSRRLLRHSEMKKWTGNLFALHTTLCIHLPGYRPLTHTVRNIIRKIQGKD